MSSKYDKSVQISREEEGSYHRREVENTPAKPGYTTTTRYEVVRPAHQSSGASRSVRPTSRGRGDTSGDDDNFEEWTTSRRKINHKTRQVETRVSRQLLVEDGKVIADSGPQVTTRIKEDNKVEECEKEKAPKNKAKFDAIDCAPEGESSGRVLGEKKEIQKRSREVREENMQYHDERFKELTGHDVHRRAIQAPHELITINDKSSSATAPRGKMVHYSSKGKKYQDTDEILEVAKLAIDGSITKEVKRTKHHEEFSDDEKPDEKGEAEALREAPMVTRSNRKHFDYVNDFDDTSTPSCSSDDEAQATRTTHRYDDNRGRKAHSQHHHPRESSHKIKKDEAFPRYERDPLLNSLNDDDFRPTKSGGGGSYLAGGRHSGRYAEHSLERKDQSSDNERDHYQVQARNRSPSLNSSSRNVPVVDIPEEYRVNKQRLLSSKHGGHTKLGSNQRLRDRSFSPTGKSSHRSHKEDASVQARLTDEEEERKSIGSSLSNANSHEKTTRKLQRQSTQNSQRNYYFGEKNRPKSPANQLRRKASLSPSSSSSSLSDPKASLRRHGARSKDSGFRSPHSARTETPTSTGSQHQIYSVSSKAKSAKNKQQQQRYEDDEDDQQQKQQTAIRHVASPTPTTGSLGQRSVKTTTTTMSAGLADRPLSRNERSASMKEGKASNKKVSKPPSPFQKLAKLFGPSNMKAKQAKAQANRQPVASR